jgi:hypothetical protein
MLFDHGPGESEHEPAVQNKKVLSSPVGLEDLGPCVIQPSVDLDVNWRTRLRLE